MSDIVKVYEGKAKDVETIIRLKPWITDEITKELKESGVEVVECRFGWSYVPSTTHFDYIVNVIA